MIDIHTHVLPHIDDGSKSIHMSISMLRESYSQGVTALAATPHFYIKNDDIESFLSKRDQAFKALKKEISSYTDIPHIYLGAEVYYFNGIGSYENIEKLTFNNTNYILLEMPFNKWNQRVFREVDELIYNRGLTPVIAHIERFIPFQKGTDNIDQLLSMKVIAQMNGEHLLGFFTRRQALKWLSSGVVKLLGSDMHNTDTRPQCLGSVADIITKKLGKEILDNTEALSRQVLGI